MLGGDSGWTAKGLAMIVLLRLAIYIYRVPQALLLLPHAPAFEGLVTCIISCRFALAGFL